MQVNDLPFTSFEDQFLRQLQSFGRPGVRGLLSSSKVILATTVLPSNSTALQYEDASAIGEPMLNMEQSGDQEVSAGVVLGLTILMAAASGLGAVPFFFVGKLSPRWSALANAVACGVMLAASFDLVHEGEPYGPGLVILGVMLGEWMRAVCTYPACTNPVVLSVEQHPDARLHIREQG